MSDVWIAAFSLLLLLAIVNSVVLVGALRQIGELYRQLADNSPSAADGPAPLSDRLVEEPILHPVAGANVEGELFTPRHMTVLAYVSPGCVTCEQMPEILNEIREDPASQGVKYALITDASEQLAEEFFKSHRIRVPFLRADGLAAYLGITVSPFVIAARKETSGDIRLIAGNAVRDASDLRGLLAFVSDTADNHSNNRPAANGRSREAELIVQSVRAREKGEPDATADQVTDDQEG